MHRGVQILLPAALALASSCKAPGDGLGAGMEYWENKAFLNGVARAGDYSDDPPPAGAPPTPVAIEVELGDLGYSGNTGLQLKAVLREVLDGLALRTGRIRRPAAAEDVAHRVEARLDALRPSPGETAFTCAVTVRILVDGAEVVARAGRAESVMPREDAARLTGVLEERADVAKPEITEGTIHDLVLVAVDKALRKLLRSIDAGFVDVPPGS